jgi:hypothetical protein
MKKAMLALLAIVLAFSSCSWNLSDDDSDLSSPKVTSKTETTKDVEKVSCYYDDVLHSYTVRFISDATARTVDQEQSYAADGTLLGVWKYHRNSSGLVDVAAYYGADRALSYSFAYVYDADEKITTQAEYNASGNLEWLRRYSLKASGSAAGQLEAAASFDGSQNLVGGLRYYFIDTASYPSKKWNLEVAYGKDSGSLSGGVAAENPKACDPTLETIQAESKIDLTLPSPGTIPAPAIPADFASAGLAVSGYRFFLEDGYGNTTVSLDSSWYPLSGTRTDSRLQKSVTVDVEHDAQMRVTSQSLHYGTTLALKVDVSYESGSSLFPVRVSTSGSSMPMPLDYQIAYGSHHEVTGISAYSHGTLVRRFAYAYSTPVTSAVTVTALRGMNPFAFMSDFLKAGLVISEYDGDGKLVETFTSTASVSGVQVTVNKPTADGAAGGAVNGTFEISFDSAGNCAAIVANDAQGNKVWSKDFSSIASMLPSLKNAAGGAFDDTVKYGTMVESLIAQSDSQTVAKIQESFVYSLLF